MTTRMRGSFPVTKAIATVQAGPEDEAGPGTFSLILSTSDLDRDGESIEQGAFDPLPDHIAMDIDHGMSVATTVGSGRPFYNEAGQLQVDGTWATTELGQNTRTLVREGHVRTASVAMIPTKKNKTEDGVTRIVKADLLNGAFTPVPSNRSAQVLSAKTATSVLDGVETLMKAGARNSKTDAAIVQAIHDLTANLGAICGNGSSEEGGSNGDVDNDGKSVAEAETKTTTDEAVETEAGIDYEDESAADAAAVKAAADAADIATVEEAVIKTASLLALTAARDALTQ